MIPTPHQAQIKILRDRNRFNVIKCGRRFGKTEMVYILSAESIQRYHRFAYFAPTYKSLSEVWQDMNNTFHDIIKSKSETLKQAEFLGGAKVDFWSMDDPDAGRGRAYNRVILDECEAAIKFQQAWEEAIRPTLTDYKGDAYLLSTPKFGDTYFKKICNNQSIHNDWKTFVFTTYDNPYIDPREIEEARLLLGEQIFNCEYMAMDVDGKASNPFLIHFDRSIHVSDVSQQPYKQLIISIDFNLNPFSVIFSNLWEDRDGMHFHTFDEIEIHNGSIPEMIDQINIRYGNCLHTALLTGDHMGRRGDIGKRDNASYYDQLQAGLKLRSNQVVTYPNPTHENSRADCNYVLFKMKDVKVSSKCKGLIRDMQSVQCDAFGGIIKRNRNDLSQRADFIDAWRYIVNSFLRTWIDKDRKMINQIPFRPTPEFKYIT